MGELFVVKNGFDEFNFFSVLRLSAKQSLICMKVFVIGNCFMQMPSSLGAPALRPWGSVAPWGGLHRLEFPSLVTFMMSQEKVCVFVGERGEASTLSQHAAALIAVKHLMTHYKKKQTPSEPMLSHYRQHMGPNVHKPGFQRSLANFAHVALTNQAFVRVPVCTNQMSNTY